MSWAIFSITQNGYQLAKQCASQFSETRIYSKYGEPDDGTEIYEGRLSTLIAEEYEKHDAMIFIMATGIVVRCIASLLKHKSTDPAVIVMDEAGNFVISLLSGHWGGANQIASAIADVTGGQAVITTASDTQGKQSVDMFAKQNGLKIRDWKKLVRIAAILVNGGKLCYINRTELNIPLSNEVAEESADALVFISHTDECVDGRESITLFAPNLILGVGCRKGKDSKELDDFVRDELKLLGVSKDAVAKVVSVDIKKEEQAILDLAINYGVETEFFDRERIAEVEDLFEGSEFVKKTLGVKAVSEPTAYLAGGKTGTFLLQKAKRNGMTLSVFEAQELVTKK